MQTIASGTTFTRFRRVRRLAACVVAGLVTALLPAAPARAGAVTGVRPFDGVSPPWQLVSVDSLLCLSPAGGSAAENTPIVQYDCDTDPARLWTWGVITDGEYWLYSTYVNLCLRPVGDSAAPGAQIVQGACSIDDPDQLWEWDNGVGRSSLWRNVGTGLCLSVTGTARNAAVVQDSCSAAAASWVLTYGQYVDNTHSWMCLSPAGGSTAPSTTIVQYYCDTDISRQWRVQPDPNGGYYLVSAWNASQCLTPAYDSTALNAPIVQYWCDTDPSRSWNLLPLSNGHYELQNASNHLCLSPAGGGIVKNTTIVQYYCDVDPARQWLITPA